MSELATVIVERRDDLQVVRLAGEVDITNAARLEEDISDAVPNDAGGLVIDLTNTEYLDSAGIRMLFELGQRLGGRRQGLAVVVPEESLVRHSLLVTELDQAMPLCETLDAAVQAIRTG